jgi:hypothetical protein
MLRAHATEMAPGRLPPKDTVRWMASRKASVVRAVGAGLLSTEEACARYGITGDEFLVWQIRLDHHGVQGLRVCALKHIKQQQSPTEARISA